MEIIKEAFNSVSYNIDANLFTLRNDNGMEVKITNYGAAITSIIIPDKNNNPIDVALGYEDLDGYISDTKYLGFTVGRYANRIGNAIISIDGQDYKLEANDKTNCLHSAGSMKNKVWEAETFQRDDIAGLTLNTTSFDGEAGFPGNLTAHVTFSLDDNNSLIIEYSAETDKPTVVNFTNHTYFNLKDGGATDVLSHILQLNAESLTPIGKSLIPEGNMLPVADTPFDFRIAKPLAKEIDDEHPQLILAGGYDHNFVLNNFNGNLRKAGELSEKSTGITMEVFTTEPGLQIYTANFLDGKAKGKSDTKLEYRHGVCLETQHFPDSPNNTQFPSTLLRPGEHYSSSTIYKFGIDWEE